jgi:hypothetical protein
VEKKSIEKSLKKMQQRSSSKRLLRGEEDHLSSQEDLNVSAKRKADVEGGVGRNGYSPTAKSSILRLRLSASMKLDSQNEISATTPLLSSETNQESEEEDDDVLSLSSDDSDVQIVSFGTYNFHELPL